MCSDETQELANIYSWMMGGWSIDGRFQYDYVYEMLSKWMTKTYGGEN